MGNAINHQASIFVIDLAKRNIPQQDQMPYQPQDEGMGKCENWIYYKQNDNKILAEYWPKVGGIRRRVERDGKTVYSWDCCNCQNKFHPDKCIKNNKQSILYYPDEMSTPLVASPPLNMRNNSNFKINN